jgi:hypothetical protein
MKYLCIIFIDEKQLHTLSSEELRELDNQSLAYDETLRKSGHFIVAEALESVHTARTIRSRKGRIAVTDGPYVETKEHLGGFILINARDMDDAVQVASKIPVGRFGIIEVRPIKELVAH